MTSTPSLRSLSRTQFTIAQWCLGLALTADFLAVVAGVVGATVPELSARATVGLAALAFMASWVRRQGARFGDLAHEILRRLDLQDSLNRPIDPRTRADLIDDVPLWVQRIAAKNESEPYFGSSEPPGVRRLLENLRESAWWTKRLAGDMANATGVFASLLNGVAVLTLLLTVTGAIDPGAMANLSHWISAAILFAIAQGPQHARTRYVQMRDGARAVEEATDRLLASARPAETDALVVAGDYHLARQTAPVIPTLWYNYRRPELNRLWDEVRADTTPAAAGGGKT